MTEHTTAIHEAGHAVIGRVLTLLCGSATIVADEAEGEFGHSLCADHWHQMEAWEHRGKYRDVHSAVRGRILTFMAGAEAEVVIFGSCVVGDGDDRVQITTMATSSDSPYDHETWPSAEPRLRRHTRRLIRRHKLVIERVADALLDRRTLSCAEIDRLISASGAAVRPHPRAINRDGRGTP